MKKIIAIVITIILVAVIYLVNIDNDIFFFAIGDSLALGKTDNGFTENNYNNYVVEQLKLENKLEKYVNSYLSNGLRINDVINDINNNKKIMVGKKQFNIKNLLIKSDLVTISLNNDDVINKYNVYYTKSELYNWIDELTSDYEALLSLIREYCKEKVVVVGYYYQKNLLIENELEMTTVISYLNDSFKEISDIYNVKYINPSSIFIENDTLMGNNYPTELGYKEIGKQIILQINN